MILAAGLFFCLQKGDTDICCSAAGGLRCRNKRGTSIFAGHFHWVSRAAVSTKAAVCQGGSVFALWCWLFHRTHDGTLWKSLDTSFILAF